MGNSVAAKFITFEGIDGSGKSTVVRAVSEGLQNSGHDVVLTTEPTKTWLGKAVKRSYVEDVSPFTEALLFLADRATHSERIRRWIDEGKVVLSDRYCDSTYAYQAARLKGMLEDPLDWLQRLSAPFVVTPDLTILLDVAPRTGLRRIESRKRMTHFERESFLKEVRKNYLALAKLGRFSVLDASRPLKEIQEDALRIVNSRL